MRTLNSDIRKSGISLIGDLPWGTHLCQFYQTKEDLLEILVPYFRAGLENNEFCVWITSKPLSVGDVKNALRKALPHFENYLKKEQMEIISRNRWHARGGKAIVSSLDRAILRGFDGLRLACNVFREKRGGEASASYEETDAISRYNVMAVFAYPRDEFDAIGIMEVVKNHRFAIVRNADKWEVIESSEARIAEDALRRNEEKLHSLFNNMAEGVAYHRIVLDDKGKPCDYVFLEVNDAFESLTGLKGEDIIGKKVTEAIPGIGKDPTDWIGKYGKVALDGKPVHFESYAEPLKRWYSISAFSPHKGYFAVTFSDITERKKFENDLLKAKTEWEKTFDSVPDLIAILDSSHRILRVNKAMSARLGLEADRCIGIRCHEAVHGTKKPLPTCPHLRSITDGREHIEEVHEPRFGGDFLVSTTPMHDEAGALLGCVHVARDITERKRMEEELRKSRDKLEIKVEERTSELSEAIERLRAEIIQRKRVEESLRESENQVRFFASQCLTAQETERKRVAGELHDTIAASLGAMKFRIERTRDEMKRGHDGLELLRDLGSNVAEIMNEVRRIMADLRPSVLDDLGIIAAMNWFCREYGKTYSHICVQKQIDISEEDLSDSLKTAIFRVSQEAMNNIAKHSKATTVTVTLQKGVGRIELAIRDNGQGFDPAAIKRGLGLSTMRERTELSGGACHIESVKGAGTTIRCTWPLA